MQAALLALLAVAFTASAIGVLRLTSCPRRVLRPESEAMRSALHHAIATLPQLRRGLDGPSAKKAAPHLRALTQAAVLAITNGESVLAVDGPGHANLTVGRLLALSQEVRDGRIHVEPNRRAAIGSDLGGPTVVAPLVIRGRGIGALAAVYEPEHRLRPEDTRVVG